MSDAPSNTSPEKPADNTAFVGHESVEGRRHHHVCHLLTATASQSTGIRVVEIAVKGRANANASLATSGLFVGIAWPARTEDGVADIDATTNPDGGVRSGRPQGHRGDSRGVRSAPRISQFARDAKPMITSAPTIAMAAPMKSVTVGR